MRKTILKKMAIITSAVSLCMLPVVYVRADDVQDNFLKDMADGYMIQMKML